MKTKLQSLREAGAVAAKLHRDVQAMIKPGLNILEIERFVKEQIDSAGMKAAFLGYKGYPAASCLSVNSTIVHGIPYPHVLAAGDVISVDLGVAQDGWIVDTARTHPVGQVEPKLTALLVATNEALTRAIEQCQVGRKVGDISHAVQATVEAAGFYVIRELTGHGVGRTLQEKPNIPNFGQPGRGLTLEEGMVLAIEPITALGKVDVAISADGWTIMADPDRPCAHYEDTVYLSPSGPIVLTK